MSAPKQHAQITVTAAADKVVTMSNYFPKGTQYFYGYPAGQSASFLNNVPPNVEELVAARANSCAGPQVSVVSFASTTAPSIDRELLRELAIPQVDPARMTILPKDITVELHGNERNEAIMSALAETVAPNSLIMAQPYVSEAMEELYQIPSKLTLWLNDKDSMSQFIAPDYLPARLGSYASGADLYSTGQALGVPCVVKVSSSSSGDGVFICLQQADLGQTMQSLRQITGKIIVEQYIATQTNYAIHFGIPHDTTKPIDIIGVNQQITTSGGDFLGGIIDGKDFPKVLLPIRQQLLNTILPAIRATGWYGVGGLDVIVDSQGKAYFIDGNFRMTGMSAYHFLINKGTIHTPIVSFSASFSGDEAAFRKMVVPQASAQSQTQIMQLIALSCHDDTWSFNGALFYETAAQLKQHIDTLLQAGISSDALEQLIKSD